MEIHMRTPCWLIAWVIMFMEIKVNENLQRKSSISSSWTTGWDKLRPFWLPIWRTCQASRNSTKIRFLNTKKRFKVSINQSKLWTAKFRETKWRSSWERTKYRSLSTSTESVQTKTQCYCSRRSKSYKPNWNKREMKWQTPKLQNWRLKTSSCKLQKRNWRRNWIKMSRVWAFSSQVRQIW